MWFSKLYKKGPSIHSVHTKWDEAKTHLGMIREVECRTAPQIFPRWVLAFFPWQLINWRTENSVPHPLANLPPQCLVYWNLSRLGVVHANVQDFVHRKIWLRVIFMGKNLLSNRSTPRWWCLSGLRRSRRQPRPSGKGSGYFLILFEWQFL